MCGSKKNIGTKTVAKAATFGCDFAFPLLLALQKGLHFGVMRAFDNACALNFCSCTGILTAIGNGKLGFPKNVMRSRLTLPGYFPCAPSFANSLKSDARKESCVAGSVTTFLNNSR